MCLARCRSMFRRGARTARAIQLYTEYDPQPPFDSGSMAKASPEVLDRAVTLGLASPEVLKRATRP